MQVRIHNTLLTLVEGDITKVKAEAMVNAANAALAGGGGVDGAIHRAGGAVILAACRELPYLSPGVKCPTGEVRSTTAGNLAATWVIHAVGPIYDSHDQVGSAKQLASTYRSALEEAVRLGARSIVFPSLSTGAFRFPVRPAAEVAMKEVVDFLRDGGSLDEVTFVLFAPKDLRLYSEVLAKVEKIH